MPTHLLHLTRQHLRHPPLIAQVHTYIHLRLDPPEAGVHDADELQRRERPPPAAPEGRGSSRGRPPAAVRQGRAGAGREQEELKGADEVVVRDSFPILKLEDNVCRDKWIRLRTRK